MSGTTAKDFYRPSERCIKAVVGAQVNVPFKVCNLGRVALPVRKPSTHHIYITPLQQYIWALLFIISWNKKSSNWVSWSVTRTTAKDPSRPSESCIKTVGGSQVNVPFKVCNLGRVASPCREGRTHHIYNTFLHQYIGALLFPVSWRKNSTNWVPCSVTRTTAKDTPTPSQRFIMTV